MPHPGAVREAGQSGSAIYTPPGQQHASSAVQKAAGISLACLMSVPRAGLQCELVVRHGLLRRCFAEWQHICEERDWKTQLATRDNEIRRLDREASSVALLSCF